MVDFLKIWAVSCLCVSIGILGIGGMVYISHQIAERFGEIAGFASIVAMTTLVSSFFVWRGTRD
jgi:hypothetical protein